MFLLTVITRLIQLKNGFHNDVALFNTFNLTLISILCNKIYMKKLTNITETNKNSAA